MMNFLRKHMRTIFVITILGFLAGAFVGFGSYFFGPASAGDAVAEINGARIPYRKYSAALNRAIDAMHRNKQEVTNETTNRLKQEVLQGLIQEEVFWQESKKYGITVTDGELSGEIQRYPAFQRDGKFDRMLYFQTLGQALHMAPREFEESQRRQIAAAKLRQLIASGARVSEQELREVYARENKGSLQNLEKDRAAFTEKLRQQTAMLVFQEWFRQLNQQLKIKVHLDEIEKGAAQQ